MDSVIHKLYRRIHRRGDAQENLLLNVIYALDHSRISPMIAREAPRGAEQLEAVASDIRHVQNTSLTEHPDDQTEGSVLVITMPITDLVLSNTTSSFSMEYQGAAFFGTLGKQLLYLQIISKVSAEKRLFYDVASKRFYINHPDPLEMEALSFFSESQGIHYSDNITPGKSDDHLPALQSLFQTPNVCPVDCRDKLPCFDDDHFSPAYLIAGGGFFANFPAEFSYYTAFNSHIGLFAINSRIYFPPVIRRAALIYTKKCGPLIRKPSLKDVAVIIGDCMLIDEQLADRGNLQQSEVALKGRKHFYFEVDPVCQTRRVCMFTRAFREKTPAWTNKRIQYVFVGNQIVKMSNIAEEIPANGFVMSVPLPSVLNGYLERKLWESNLVEYSLIGLTDLEWALAAGPMLLERGKVVIDQTLFEGHRGYQSEQWSEGVLIPYYFPHNIFAKRARHAVGIKPRGEAVLLTVDRNKENPAYSAGIGLLDLALLMKEQGCVDAINMDGGGSVAVVKSHVPGKYTLLNESSDGPSKLRSITTALRVDVAS